MPALKPTYATRDDIPEALRDFYEARDGKMVLVLDGVPVGFATAASLAEANGKVTEYRDTNIAVLKAIKEILGVDAGSDIAQFGQMLKTKFDGVDPDNYRTMVAKFKDVDPVEYKTLKAKAAELAGKGVQGVDDVTKLINDALAQAMTPLTAQLTELGNKLTASEAARGEAQTALVRKDFETKLTQAGLKAGVDEKMVPHFVRHALDTFQFENGGFVPKRNGTPLFSPERPAEMLSIDDWIGQQVTETPGFFKPSGGGGTPPNTNQPGKPGARVLKNPSAADLGKNADAIMKGDVVVEYSE